MQPTTPGIVSGNLGTIETSRLVFIGGLHRSGTTLVAKLLGAHPDVSGLSDTGVWEDEGQHVQNVYPAADRFGGPGRFAFSDTAHLTESSDVVSDSSRERILRAWQPYWDLDRRLLVEKSPPNLIRFRFLHALFPSARFVAVVRHPVPVSFATQRLYRKLHRRWSRPSIQTLLSHWIRAYDVFEADRPFVERLTVIRYEELTRDPIGVLNGLADELGIDRFSVLPIGVTSDRSERYFTAWRRHLAKPILGPHRRRQAEALESDVRRWGYTLFEE